MNNDEMRTYMILVWSAYWEFKKGHGAWNWRQHEQVSNRKQCLIAFLLDNPQHVIVLAEQ